MGHEASTRRRLLAGLAATAAVAGLRAARAQSIEVLTLRWRSAEDLLPLLQPFVEPGGALTGRGSQLFLRASPANRRQIGDLLARLDRAPRQLLITVSQDRSDDGSQRRFGADGSVTVTTRRSTGALSVEAGNTRSSGTRAATQSVRVLEGRRASLAIGSAIPFTFRQWAVTPQGLTELAGTTYYEAVTGFSVRPHVSGDVVTLELSPEDARFTGSGSERSALMTTVQGRLGEWIPLGGAELHGESSERGIATVDSRSSTSRHGAWVRVEAVDASR